MLRRTGRYLGNNLLGLLALLVAVSGTAYAAATIGSPEIIDESVRSVDIKDGGVGSTDLLDDAVTGTDIRNGSVREGDVAPVPWQPVRRPSLYDNCYEEPPLTGEFCLEYDSEWGDYGAGYQTARYRRDVSGEVHLEGLVKEAGDQAGVDDSGAIFVLPRGYRPAATVLLPVACGDVAHDEHGVLEVRPTGLVLFRDYWSDCTTTNYVSLSGVSFAAG